MNANDEVSGVRELVDDWRWNDAPELQSVFAFHATRMMVRALETMTSELERVSDEGRTLKGRCDRLQSLMEHEHRKAAQAGGTAAVILSTWDWLRVLYMLNDASGRDPSCQDLYGRIRAQVPILNPKEEGA